MKNEISDSLRERAAACRMIVLGSSAGGIEALKKILPKLSKDYPLSVALVQHIGSESPQILAQFFSGLCSVSVKEAEDKEKIEPSHVYLAPVGYHLMISEDFTFSLTVEEPVNFARPSIDVLFETAAVAYREKLIGVVLTGSNEDGAAGLAAIKNYGGVTIAQDPNTAQFPPMPLAAINLVAPDLILPVEKISSFLVGLKSSPSELL